MSEFSFYKQHNYCVSGKKAIKSYPDGVYLCVDHGGVCSYRRCLELKLDKHLQADKIIKT